METRVDIGTLIVRSPDIRGGRPRIAGTGMTVQRIVGWYKLGLAPEDISDQVGHLSLAQVYAALAYYHANKEEIEVAMDAEIKEAAALETKAVDFSDDELRSEYDLSQLQGGVKGKCALRVSQPPIETTVAEQDETGRQVGFDELCKQLHDRATRGEALSAQERALLETWYAAQDRAERDALGLTGPETIAVLQAQVDSILAQLEAAVKRIQELAQENDRLCAEIATLTRAARR